LVTIVTTTIQCGKPYYDDYDVPNYIVLNFEKTIENEYLVILGYSKLSGHLVFDYNVAGADSINNDSRIVIKMTTKMGESGDGVFAGGRWSQTVEDSDSLDLTYGIESLPDLPAAPKNKIYFPVDWDNSKYHIAGIKAVDLIKENDSVYAWPGKIQFEKISN